MKLIVLLSVVAWSSGAKLDRNYLPPSFAQTSGGNGNFLQTPIARPQNYQNAGFAQNNGITGANANFGQNYKQDEDFTPNSDYQQSENFGQDNAFPQNDEYAQNGNDFSQDNSYAQNSNADVNSFNNFESRPERAQAAFERNAAILRQENRNDGETYSYAYETENGIVAEENGVATNGVEAQGGYSYTGDDGQVYSVRYTADQNGFQPTGDHLPTPPPIPEEILKALEQNARDEANGIYDDGTYSEGKYGAEGSNGNFDGSGNNGYNYDSENNLNNDANNFNAGGDFSGDSNSFNAGNINNDDSVVTSNALLRSSNGVSGSGSQNGINKAYLPPFERNGQRTQAVASRYNQNNGFRSQPSTFNQGSNGFNKQALNDFSNGVEKAYLPPEQFGQRNQNGARRNPLNSFSRPTSNIQRNGGSRTNGSKGVDKTYLPPFESDPNAPSTIYDQSQNFGQRSQKITARNGANRQYLPPSANQRNNGRISSSRRPSYSARNGYQY